MKPAANLSASLIVRKGLATPSNLTRQFALDDPPALPEAMSAAPSSYKTLPIIDNLDVGYSERAPEPPVSNEIVTGQQKAPPLENLRPDPIQIVESEKTPAPKAAGGPLTIISRRVPRQAPAEAETKTPRQAPAEEASATQPHNEQNSVVTPARRPVGLGARIAMTVRLDHDQHKELHAFADSRGRSCQDVFVCALETYMAIYR